MNRRILDNWNAFVRNAGIDAEFKTYVTRLDAGYTEPGRYYHSWDHIIHCITLLKSHLDLATDPIGVETALWFHDLVYAPGSRDNERLSAETAALFCDTVGFDETRKHAIQTHILATAHHTDQNGEIADTDLVLDIDLSILGAEPSAYDTYERSIRLEYAHMEELLFAEGRAKILSKLLQKKHLYRTDRFRNLYESAARVNLNRAMGMLKF